MDILQKFAENLRYLIEDRSVGEVAYGIGIPQQTLHRYLHCERQIGLLNLVKIANYFHVSIDFLVGLRDD